MIYSLVNISNTGDIRVTDLLLVLLSAVVLGAIVSAIYIFVNRKEKYSRGLAFTLIMLPAITSTIILLCNTMVTAFSIAGAFSIIRFRSTQGNPKDLAFIFSTLAIGLACGKGYIVAALILVAVIGVVMVLLSLIGFATPRNVKKKGTIEPSPCLPLSPLSPGDGSLCFVFSSYFFVSIQLNNLSRI